MAAYVNNTSYQFLSRRPGLDELNFWRPGTASFRALSRGVPLLFKLKPPATQSLASRSSFISPTLPTLARAVAVNFKKPTPNHLVGFFIVPTDASGQVQIHAVVYSRYTERRSRRTS